MDPVTPRFELPVRDLLRFALPGALATAYVEAAMFAYRGTGLDLDTSIPPFLGMSLLLGVSSFAIGVHKRLRPWRGKWEAFVELIRLELKKISGDPIHGEDPVAKSIYKIWLEGSVEESRLKSHLLYQTGIFYAFVSMTFWSFTAAIVTSAYGVLSAFLSAQCGYEFAGATWLRFLLPVVAVALGLLFKRQSFETLEDLQNETLAAIRLDHQKIRELAEATGQQP